MLVHKAYRFRICPTKEQQVLTHKPLVAVFFCSTTSQLCSDCGCKNKAVKNLAVREWTCPACVSVHNRDLNASKNIKTEAIRLLTAGTAGVA